MATQPSRNPSCTKRGVILTCYVDGKKRFKAMAIDADRTPAAPTLDRGMTRPNHPTQMSMATGVYGQLGF